MSILGKIVGQLENVGDGSSGGASPGMNYIKTEIYPVVKTDQYPTGFVIANLAEDNKLYKFDVEMTVDNTSLSKNYKVYAYGFTYNKEVILLSYQKPSDGEGYLFTKDDEKLLIGASSTQTMTIQLEGYTTLTQEEVVYEKPSTQSEIKTSTYLFNRLDSLESKVSSLESAKSTIESRLTALESAGSG